ncbi:CDP-diacylglycerol--glycerol-3-phosphate 3-phosphatidyltransferase [Endozoicomonas montiporae]|uniref:CDP-diacylglycerol--glycerol-3-phosphate 3-phosphatidyltransferase n=2 Tax=Endozoicomonas montiporae TaxID=1027273 RepID=A0A081N6X1_9GAMM|nr:CDP-diacylglycerol--glycerol-3-phosphate 3-phosphatidyltransferase [Endozoicomonas montiporae]AMO56543.1 CDP-diacylglycerol--glycerol-3-phosphate 3-phosphatidyltransferase [Endozoicomonas montiporae CL-33]KEQ14194.1 CDP-diacylglycerol--glycerol-3-phosphate 3-phosphatidyltransferase [Endozoicomonas montiporae]
MNVPNILTSLRIVLVPFLVLVFYLPYEWRYLASASIFAVAAVTDWFDGYLARRWNQTTAFGAFFDPVADKIMVATALCLLIEEFGAFWMTVPSMIIIGREIVISALREWMAELGKRTSVAVNRIGKLKTAAQMLAITLLLLTPVPMAGIIGYIGLILLYASAVLTLWSMYVYLRAAWPDLSPFSKG